MSGDSLTRNQARAICLAVLLVFSAMAVGDLYWMLAHTRLPLWAVVLLMLPATFILWLIWRGWRAAGNVEQTALRRLGVPLFFLAFCIAYYVGVQGANYLFLTYLYGFSHVQSEHLHLIRMGKFQPWLVLAGSRVIDHVTDHAVWEQIQSSTTITVFFSTFLSIYRLLPKRGAPCGT